MNVRQFFPNASQSTIDANSSNPGAPASLTQLAKENDSGAILSKPKAKRGVMNASEKEFSLYLEALRTKGEILRWVFEGITLRWEGVKYTPDFVVIRDVNMTPDADNWLVFIEIKGGYLKGKYERAIERFRHARSMWPEFAFEMHHRTKSGWKRIL